PSAIARADKAVKPAREVVAPVPPVEKMTLLVANRNLPMHTIVRGNLGDCFIEKTVLKADAPADALMPNDLAKLQGKCLTRSVREGDVFHVDDFKEMYRKFVTPTKHRHVAFRTSIDSLPAAMARLPGSHVNLIWTYREPDSERVVKMGLVQDVIVVAVEPGE